MIGYSSTWPDGLILWPDGLSAQRVHKKDLILFQEKKKYNSRISSQNNNKPLLYKKYVANKPNKRQEMGWDDIS